MRFAARFLVFSVLFFIFSSFILHPLSFAQATQSQDLHNYTQNVMIEVTSSLTCMLAGIDPIRPDQKCLGVANGKIGPIDSKGGAIGGMASLIAMTYTPPASSIDFTRYLAGNFGIAKSAYAQGIGFESLNPLIKIWIAFRNMTYLLFVLIFVAIGFAIMLRVHIDPRTIMSIENQIPKIIVGLILVTFSFAIVGVLIDLMWVSTYLAVNVFNSIYDNKLTSQFINFQGLNVFEVANNLNLKGGESGIRGIAFIATGAIREIVAGVFGGLDWFVIGGVIQGIVSGLALIIVAIALLFALFRLWFQLIKAYVMILIVAVFSPFWILAGLLPGSKLSLESLLRELGSNLVTFPATMVMFLLAKTFIDLFGDSKSAGIFVPPLIGNPVADGLKTIGALAGLGIILLTPDVNKMMRKALQAPEFDFSAIGKAIGAGAAAPTRLMGAGFTALTTKRDDKSGQLVYRQGPVAAGLRLLGLAR